jgi:hypothetical protein
MRSEAISIRQFLLTVEVAGSLPCRVFDYVSLTGDLLAQRNGLLAAGHSKESVVFLP